jgi:CheY-like chemotaxis protein
VVVAEDNDAMRSLLCEVLEEEGCEVVPVRDGRELFWEVERSLRSDPFALIVSDVAMPTYDGLEVLEAWGEDVPRSACVILSGFGNESARQRAEDLGATVLSKPCPMDVLRRTVRRLLSLKEEPS